MVAYLILNAGSSTLKASLVESGSERMLGRATVDWGSDATRAADRRRSVARVLADLAAEPSAIAAVGHRFVHGGVSFRAPTLLDDTTLTELDAMSELAPLHNPAAVETAGAAMELLPDLAHVAAFDTAFHASLPAEAFVYPLPWHWYADWGFRRFGFHGLSVEWSVGRAAELLDRPSEELGLVVAHLGSGCSVTAVSNGRSVATSMGYTPLEGLMMGSRAGSVDPGLLVEVLRRQLISGEALGPTLTHDSGLRGVSGVSGDVREVQAAADRGDERASLALDIFARRAAEGIAAAAVALPRLDGLVFTGGIGEHAGRLRAAIVRRLAVLGVAPVSDEESGQDRVVSAAGVKPAVLRIEAREDLVIARAVATLA